MARGSNTKATLGKAIAVLNADHQRIQDLCQAYETAADPRVKQEIAKEACMESEIRAQIEKHIFSPAVNEETDSTRQTMPKQEALAKILERVKSEVLSIFQDRPIQFPRWRPTNREQYFLILGGGEIKSFQWHETSFDQEAWFFGNCFRSIKEATQARNLIKDILLNFHQNL